MFYFEQKLKKYKKKLINFIDFFLLILYYYSIKKLKYINKNLLIDGGDGFWVK